MVNVNTVKSVVLEKYSYHERWSEEMSGHVVKMLTVVFGVVLEFEDVGQQNLHCSCSFVCFLVCLGFSQHCLAFVG